MKYLHLIVVIIALIFFGCSDQTTETHINTEAEKEIRNGQYVFPPFPHDGLIQQIGNFNNGKKEGVFMFFDTKGDVIAQEYYVNNKLHGTQITVHSTGKIHKSVTYENDVKHGPYVTNYKTGKKQETGSYKEGKKDGEIIFYYDTGQKHSVYTYENGKVIDGPITYSKEGAENQQDHHDHQHDH